MTSPRPWTDEELVVAREHLVVDPSSPSGLAWKKRRRGVSKRVGDPAGYRRYDGYWWIGINRRKSNAARWVLLLSGDIPECRWLEIDHIDGNPSNNKRENLRWVADNSEQSLNRPYNSSTGIRWVHKQPRHGSYFYQFVIPRTKPRRYVRGCGFRTPEEAHVAVIKKRRELGLYISERLAVC